MPDEKNLSPWADDVPLAGTRRPKNTGHIDYLIEYLLTVRKRFGNTAVSVKELSWGASALWSHDELRTALEAAERERDEMRVTLREIGEWIAKRAATARAAAGESK